MARPTFSDYRANSVPIMSGSEIVVNNETLKERWLTCLSAIASQQNPDGTAW